MANQGDEPSPFDEVGKRIALVRRALGLNQTDMAARLNLNTTRWNNWELGVNQIPPNEALRLKRMLPGLSTDWIYDGDQSRISHELVLLFDRLANTPEPPTKKRGRPSRH